MLALWEFNEPAGTPVSQTLNSGTAPGTWAPDLTGGEGALADGQGHLRIRASGTYSNGNMTYWEPGVTVADSGTVFLVVEFSQFMLDTALPSGGFGEIFGISTLNESTSRSSQAMMQMRRNGTTNAVEIYGYSSSTATSGTGTSSPYMQLAPTPELPDGLTLVLELDYTGLQYRLHAKVGDEPWRRYLAAGSLYPGAALTGLRIRVANQWTQEGDEAWIDRIYLTTETPLGEDPGGTVGDILIGEGSAYASPAVVVDSGRPGPTVVAVGGMGQSVAVVHQAAQIIRQWDLQAGRLVFMPELVLPAGDSGGTALTRSFPQAADAEPTHAGAAELWAFLAAERPDLLLELRSTSSTPWTTSPGNYANVLLASGGIEGVNHAASMRSRVDHAVAAPGYEYHRTSSPGQGLLVRAAYDWLDVPGVIAYVTTREQDEDLRLGQVLTLVYAALERAGMVAYGETMPGLPPAVVDNRDYASLRQGKLAVAIYDGYGSTGGGIPNVRAEMRARDDVYVALLADHDIDHGMLRHFDVVVFSGGSGSSQAHSIGELGRDNVRAFLAAGGGYVGICAGAYLAMHNYSWGLKILNAKTKSGLWRRGTGDVEMELSDLGRERLESTVGLTAVRYANGPIMEPAGAPDLPPYAVLSTFRTELAENNTPVGIMVDSPAIIAGDYGAGRVMVISPHPESSEDLRHLISGAVNWVGRRHEAPAVPPSFAAWAEVFCPPGKRQPGDDALGSGRPNLLNFALLVPTGGGAAAEALLPRLESDMDGHLRFAHRRHRGGSVAGNGVDYAVNGLRYIPVFSPDLVAELTGADAWEVVSGAEDNGDGTETVTLRTRMPISQGFAWLRVDLE